MSSTPIAPAAPVARPGYDPDAVATARRVLPMLEEERVVWLSTVHPDGTPHLVPTWFWWTGEALLFWSKPGAVKVRNLRANPRLMVAVGDAAADFSVGLIEAVAEPADIAVPEAFFAKYAGELAEAQLDREGFAGLYTQAMRVVPTRFLAWHGRGGRHGAVAPGHGVARRSMSHGRRAGAHLAHRLASLLEGTSARLRRAATAPPTPAAA